MKSVVTWTHSVMVLFYQLQKPVSVSGDECLFEEDLFEPVRSDLVLKVSDGDNLMFPLDVSVELH